MSLKAAALALQGILLVAALFRVIEQTCDPISTLPCKTGCGRSITGATLQSGDALAERRELRFERSHPICQVRDRFRVR